MYLKRYAIHAVLILLLFMNPITYVFAEFDDLPGLQEGSGSGGNDAPSFLELLFREKTAEPAQPEDRLQNGNEEGDEEAITDSPGRSDAAAEQMQGTARETVLFSSRGEGWILESITESGGGQTDKLRFSGREYSGGNTVFSFYPFESGSFEIALRKSDYSSGIVERKRIILEVLESLQDAEPDPEPEQLTPVVKPDEDEDAEQVESVLNVKKTQADSEKHTDAAAAVTAAGRLADSGNCEAAVSILEECLGYLSWNELDAIYYALAGYYEKCSAMRDERKAAEYYSQIVDYYPISIYWEEAKEREVYLERNYIYIR